MFDATEVVPINFVFFTASAIVAGMSSSIEMSLCHSLHSVLCMFYFFLIVDKSHEKTKTNNEAMPTSIVCVSKA